MDEQFYNVTIKNISDEMQIKQVHIKQLIQLVDEGNTVPFIARYRKEATGGLDEVQIRTIVEKWTYANQLAKRKEEVLRLIEEQGKLDEKLQIQITRANKLQEVEDLYRPYKQKRRTRATVAKEKGLQPFADWLLSFPNDGQVEEEAAKYFSEEYELVSFEDVVKGAQDIIAEVVSDRADLRQLVRTIGEKEGKLVSSVKDQTLDEKSVYEMYYEYEESIRQIVPHRILAVNRGEKEGVLKVVLALPIERIIRELERKVIEKERSLTTEYIQEAIADAYKRLIEPSIEREIRNELTEKAEEQAIHIFAENLRNLLLQPPMKDKIVLGVDPAFRTGCKLAVVDATGKVLDIAVIYPNAPRNEVDKASKVVMQLIKKHKVEMIAIGNGTASRETEQFIANIMKELDEGIHYLIVNEAGASVYSASDLGREEFPDLETEERSAVSIARRLQDPLAELVKIDPKSVGVGQYQHDVSQKRLNESLAFVVETVVNQVGVNVNTASSALLQHVAGLSKTVATNIVKQRDEEGRFTNRKQLKTVKRLGAKSYEQAVGFLRIQEGDQPLDGTAIHPENYESTMKLLTQLNADVHQIGTEALKEQLQQMDITSVAEQLELGVPTLKDIVDSLIKPSRDPRDDVAKPLLKQDVLQLKDLHEGMEMQGTVRNVVDFGAFIDIGVEQDGLVHISKLTNRFVKHPLEVVQVGQIVTVWIEQVDTKKGRIALTMKSNKK